MKKLFCLLALGVSLQVSAQTSTAKQLSVQLPEVTDVKGLWVSSTGIHQKQEIRLLVPVFNPVQDKVIPAGSVKLMIDLGTKLAVPAGAAFGTSSLAEYFNWSQSKDANGSTILVGDLKANLPADFLGRASLPLVCLEKGRADIHLQWVSAVTNAKRKSSNNITTFTMQIN
jgi:hypothetical protein